MSKPLSFLLVLSFVFFLASVAPAEIKVSDDWLVLSPVDRRARQPFNPDAVFADYLLTPGKRFPAAGATVSGTRGERAWRLAAPDEKGRIAGRFGWAYAIVESDRDQTALATLNGGAVLYVNGTASIGDIYGYGHGGLPVHLRKGKNHVFVRGVRGSFKLAFREVEPGVHLMPQSATLPDLVAGESLDAEGSVVVVNTADRMLHNVPAGGVRRLAVRIRHAALAAGRGAGKIELELSPAAGLSGKFSLDVREPTQAYRVTFRSGIDGSVQYYGIRRPKNSAGAGIVLTLHGASVHARNQADCYAPKSDLWIVAPTNRRPFGFDWQDWGRTDAYEVLADATARTRARGDRVYLTGHSMGGHGAWHLGANDPDLWLGVAPCAAWESFDTYGRGGRKGIWLKVWRGADLAGATPLLLDNLAQLPVFILHGEEDSTVSPKEARRMETALRKAGAKPRMHLEPGKGHWYNGNASEGVDCVDWPGIFEMFESTPARTRTPKEIHFVCADPAIDARHYWVTLHQPLTYGEVCRMEGRIADDTVVLKTDNVRRLSLADVPLNVEIDGQKLNGKHFLRTDGKWAASDPDATEKSPARSGPFKRAFARRFVFVYAASDPASRARALYDAQRWWYIGNGDCTVVSDAQFLFGNYSDRNVILYGNADGNRAWKRVLADTCPIDVRQGAVTIGKQRYEGDDLGCFFVYPRKGEAQALVGVVGYSGVTGARAGANVSVFAAGVGIPDYMVFGSDVLRKGDDGVRAAGWFDHGWKVTD